MCDAAPKTRLLRVLLVDVQRILIAADAGEQQEIGLGDRLGERGAIAHGECFKRLLVVGHVSETPSEVGL